MNDLEREVRDTLLRHRDDAPSFDTSEARRVAGRARRRQARNAVVGMVGAAAVIVAFAGPGGLVRADRPPTVLDRPSSSPTPVETPGPDDAEVHGWPGTTRNPAGVYSFDARVDAGWMLSDGDTKLMHNGYDPGSGDVTIIFEAVPGRLIPHRGRTAVTVAGYEGTYRRFIGEDSLAGWMDGLPSEEWMVDIQGTTVTILLIAEPGARDTELAEAHEIIESILVEPQDTELGFRLLFTLTSDTWDSG